MENESKTEAGVEGTRSGALTDEEVASFWEELESRGEVFDNVSFLLQGLVHDLNNHITVIAHSVEVAEMIHELSRYGEICGDVADTCEKARIALGRVGELVRLRDAEVRRFDLAEATREVARRVRASLPVADSLRVCVAEAADLRDRALVYGSVREVQELFLYLVGVLAPMDDSRDRRPVLNVKMAAAAGVDGAGGWAWIFETEAGAEPPFFWRALMSAQAEGRGAVTTAPVLRARAILERHFARLDWVAETGGLRVWWPRRNDGPGAEAGTMPQDAQPAEGRGAGAAKLAGKEIAVVNKNMSRLQLWRDALESAGAQVSVFENLDDFLRWLPGGAPPQKVVLDEDALCGKVDYLAGKLAGHPSLKVVVSRESLITASADCERWKWAQVSTEKGPAFWLAAVADG